MHCPFCNADETKVIDSRLVAEGNQVRRRRECLHDLFRIHRHLSAIANFTGWASPSDMNGLSISEGSISRIVADQQSRYAAITNLRTHKTAKALPQVWIKR